MQLISLSASAQTEMSKYDAAMARKDYDAATTALTQLLKDHNNRNSSTYYKRALAYAYNGNYIFAIADCTSAISLDPNNAKAFYLRGKCKSEIGDPTYVKDMQKGGNEGQTFLQGKNISTPNEKKESYGNIISDVDINIPSSAMSNSNTFVLIFSNENYQESNISSVNYAKNDGETFKKYCIKTLGIPENNIHLRHDATRNQMRSEVKWAQNVANAFGKQANFLIYYSGHGMPDEESRRAYLLPTDGIANDPESAYSLSTLYSQLGSMDVNSVIVFLDACFSGNQRNGGMLTASKGVAIKPKEETLKGNVVVISASQGDETAYPYKEKGHGLFTYFLLKILQESKGNIKLSELGDYLTKNVRQTSIINNGKNQTPSISMSPSLSDSWYNIRLK